MKRLALVLAALATGVAAFWVVRLARTDSDRPPPDAAVAARPSLPSGPAGPAGPPPPVTPPGPAPGTATAATADAPSTPPPAPPGPGGRSFAFESESRDPAWADEQEREMTLRMRKIVDGLTAAGAVVDVDAIECRRSLCRVSLHARDVASLGKMYGALESADGLYGWADNVLLDSVETERDGQVKTRVTAVFDRE